MAENPHPFKPSLVAALSKLDPEDSEQIVDYFKTQMLLLREKALLQASVREEKKLLVENAKLKKDISDLKVQLQEKQRKKTAKALFAPVPAPPRPSPPPVSQPVSSGLTAPPAGDTTAAEPTHHSKPPPRERTGRRRRGERKGRTSSESLGEEPRVDVSRLDIRIGRILSVRGHPLAETLCVKEVDVGEPSPRTVVIKLGAQTDREQLQGSLAVLVCNVRPCKLKGVVSQARLLCCSALNDHIELLAPPTGSTPGDRVTFLNYPGDPDKELQVKDGVWDVVQCDLQTDSRGVANYKGAGFEVRGKGLCRAPTLINSSIK